MILNKQLTKFLTHIKYPTILATLILSLSLYFRNLIIFLCLDFSFISFLFPLGFSNILYLTIQCCS